MKISRFFKYLILLSVFLFCVVLFSYVFIKSWQGGEKKTITIHGPQELLPGELGVFMLPKHVKCVRWSVFPEVESYIDTDGKTLVFSSKEECAYTIIAAFTESSLLSNKGGGSSNTQENLELLVHRCTYKHQDVDPSPSPDPAPIPPVPLTLEAWVQQNAPRDNAVVLDGYADIYTSVSLSIDRGGIRTPSAAFAAIRSQIQVKSGSELWHNFWESLSCQIDQRMKDNSNMEFLSSMFKDIASGLKKVKS